VPFPVSNEGDAILMEYVGSREEAAPRLAQYRTDRSGLRDLFDQVRAGVLALALAGVVHADLSPYNVLVWEGRVWLIDLPQAVPYLANLDATDLLHRDCTNVCAWFVRKGLEVDAEDLFVEALDALFALQMRDMFRAER
jgi:RIO kinase 1